MFHTNEIFRIKVHNNILISLLKRKLKKKHFKITKDIIELYYIKNELLDTISFISYNIKYNDNVEVVVRTTKVVDEKGINITQTNVVCENDQDE